MGRERRQNQHLLQKTRCDSGEENRSRIATADCIFHSTAATTVVCPVTTIAIRNNPVDPFVELMKEFGPSTVVQVRTDQSRIFILQRITTEIDRVGISCEISGAAFSLAF